MSIQGRRSSFISNIDNWLDRCSSGEPDSIIYEPDYPNEVAAFRAKQKEPEIESLYRSAADICAKIGLSPQTIEERLTDVDECITNCLQDLQKQATDEYEKLCQFKETLLIQIQKMTKDLYLTPYEPEDNLTLLQHCKKLKARHGELNIVKEKRMSRLQELRDKQAKHCLVLGIKAPVMKLQTDIPTEEELAKLASAVIELEREERRRKEKYDLLKTMISRCMDDLEYAPEGEFERNIVSDKPSYTEAHLLKMTNLHSKLENQYAVNQQKYEKLKDRLISLYDRLDVDQVEREVFLEIHNVCKPTLMAEMEAEIDRYEELKRQNIGKFIDKIKDELIVEYERCYVSQEQQDNFFSLSTVSGELNEEILELYERELERIKRYYAHNKDILEKFHKWRMMWKELIDLEVKANDPNRFNNRGGQLLIEEKKRKTLQKSLPKIEKELIQMNEKYAAENENNKFKIFDTNVDEFIAGCWEELNAAKEEEKRERQRAKMTSQADSNNAKGRKPIQQQAVIKRTPTKRAAGVGITPTPSKLQCQRSILGTPMQNTFKSSNTNLASNSVKKPAQRNLYLQPNTNSNVRKQPPPGSKVSCIPVSNQSKGKPSAPASNSNGSDFSNLSINEQEFEDIIVTCPASAKRPR